MNYTNCNITHLDDIFVYYLTNLTIYLHQFDQWTSKHYFIVWTIHLWWIILFTIYGKDSYIIHIFLAIWNNKGVTNFYMLHDYSEATITA